VANNKIEIKLRGTKADNDLVRLSDFIAELHATSDILNHIDRTVSRAASPSLYYRVTDLRYGSPAIVEVEAVPVEPSENHSEAVVDRFFVGLRDIKERRAPTEFDRELLELYTKIGGVFRKNITEISFSSERAEVTLTEDLGVAVKDILGKDEIAQGAVSGILEYINIHAGANRFYIYPVAGARRIDCHFPGSLLEAAIGAVNRYINVRGKVKYKKRDCFPYSVEVEDLEIFPKESELPTLFDLRGLAPDATGDLSSEEFVSRIRNVE